MEKILTDRVKETLIALSKRLGPNNPLPYIAVFYDLPWVGQCGIGRRQRCLHFIVVMLRFLGFSLADTIRSIYKFLDDDTEKKRRFIGKDTDVSYFPLYFYDGIFKTGVESVESEGLATHESEADILQTIALLREIGIDEKTIGETLRHVFRIQEEKIIDMALDFWRNSGKPLHKEVAHILNGAQLL